MRRGSALLFLYAIVTITFFDNFAQLPIMANYAKSMGALNLGMVGVVIAMYSITNMVGNFGAGFFINRFGHRAAISGGLAMAGSAVLFYAMVQKLEGLLVIRAWHGLAVAVITPAAYALIGDHSRDEQRGQSMAFSGAAIALAAMIGPMVSGILSSKVAVIAPFIFDAVLLTVMAVVSFLVIQEHRCEEEICREKPELKKLLDPGLWVAFIASLMMMFAQGVLTSYLPIYAEDLGYNAALRGMLFSSFAAASLILFLTPANRWSDRVGRYKPIYLGLMLIALSTGAMAWMKTFPLLAGAMFIYGLGFGLIFPASSALIVDLTRGVYRSIAFGIYYGMFSVGVIFSSLFTGWAKDLWGISPFLIGGIAAVLGLIAVIPLAYKKAPAAPTEPFNLTEEE